MFGSSLNVAADRQILARCAIADEDQVSVGAKPSEPAVTAITPLQGKKERGRKTAREGESTGGQNQNTPGMLHSYQRQNKVNTLSLQCQMSQVSRQGCRDKFRLFSLARFVRVPAQGRLRLIAYNCYYYF